MFRTQIHLDTIQVTFEGHDHQIKFTVTVQIYKRKTFSALRRWSQSHGQLKADMNWKVYEVSKWSVRP